MSPDTRPDDSSDAKDPTSELSRSGGGTMLRPHPDSSWWMPRSSGKTRSSGLPKRCVTCRATASNSFPMERGSWHKSQLRSFIRERQRTTATCKVEEGCFKSTQRAVTGCSFGPRACWSQAAERAWYIQIGAPQASSLNSPSCSIVGKPACKRGIATV